jgi:prepilin-type N-terminal cleavage/methylation domain-containing protein
MNLHSKNNRLAFSLIELLVVIGIIAILAAMLMPAVLKGMNTGKVTKAKMEMVRLNTAITKYETDYGRMPVSSLAMQRSAAGNEDYTYGGSFLNLALGPGNWISDNNEVMAVLLDLEKFGDGTVTINAGHVKNPQRSVSFEAKWVSDKVSPGIGLDGILRDPWGNPYIISMDLNGDGRCSDAFYSRWQVSQQSGQIGLNGLFNSTDATGVGNHFECKNPIMIWSLGPDGKADPAKQANKDVNRDNVLSW